MPYFHNSERAPKILQTRIKKKKECSPWKTRLGAGVVARLVNLEENNCQFQVQREEHMINLRPTRLIANWLRGDNPIFPRNFQVFFVAVITFFSLSSVQIIFIPACCLLCVL